MRRRCFEPLAMSAQSESECDADTSASMPEAAAREAGSFVSQSFRWKQATKNA